MAIDFSYIDHDVLGDVADAIRFVEGSTAGIVPADYPQRIRALDKYIPDYDVLNFYMPNGGTISLNKSGSPTVVELEYWLDANGQWLIWQSDSNGNRSLTLTAGQTMYVRNTSETRTSFSLSTSYYNFSFSGTTEAHGNINSLLCRNAAIVTTLDSYIFRSLFQGCTSLATAPNLPATTLAANCYRTMFYECTSLATAPDLPATTLATRCYMYMFQGCTSLATAPNLPATTLAVECYRSMFFGCTSLATAPNLPATTLATGCYRSMFQNCALLTEIRTLMNNITPTNCITGWLLYVAETGDFYCPAELTIPTGTSGIPSGWTRHDLT